jgi:YceI-like domain
VFKSLTVAALALTLAACGALKARHAAPPNPQESASRPALPLPGTVYRIDETQSELRVLVYRAGPLARLGHNHVMVNRAIRGTVNLADDVSASVFSLNIPVAAFVVDDAQARREEGADFTAEVPDDAKSGTLHNMLSAAVLDADEFPAIIIAGAAASRTEGASRAPAPRATPDAVTPSAVARSAVTLVASVAISVAGHQSTIDVPFTLQKDGDRLSATGSMELRQSVLGLIPYSLMLGALQVQDAMTIKFKIVAVPGPG